MFEKFQVSGYDKEKDVAIQVTTSDLSIALSQYEQIKEVCDEGHIVDADTGEVYAHFYYTKDNNSISKNEWATIEFLETVDEVFEYGCP